MTKDDFQHRERAGLEGGTVLPTTSTLYGTWVLLNALKCVKYIPPTYSKGAIQWRLKETWGKEIWYPKVIYKSFLSIIMGAHWTKYKRRIFVFRSIFAVFCILRFCYLLVFLLGVHQGFISIYSCSFPSHSLPCYFIWNVLKPTYSGTPQELVQYYCLYFASHFLNVFFLLSF